MTTLLTKLRSAATRVRARLFTLACVLHWQKYGPKGTDTEIIFMLYEDRTECSVECEAVGGELHCMCVLQEDEEWLDAWVREHGGP